MQNEKLDIPVASEIKKDFITIIENIKDKKNKEILEKQKKINEEKQHMKEQVFQIIKDKLDNNNFEYFEYDGLLLKFYYNDFLIKPRFYDFSIYDFRQDIIKLLREEYNYPNDYDISIVGRVCKDFTIRLYKPTFNNYCSIQ